MDRLTTPATSVVVLLGLLTLLPGPARAGVDATCLQLPEGLDLRPGEALQWGDTSLLLGLERLPPRFDPDHGEDAATEGGNERLRLALHARPVDRSGRPRASVLVRGLEVRFALEGRDGLLASGEMAPSLTPSGPAYAADVEVSPGETTMSLRVDLVDPHPPVGPDHDPVEPCPRVPPSMRFTFDFVEAVARASSAEASPDAPGDDRNVTVLGTLDPNAPDSYSDIWGYDDGATFLAILGSTDGTTFVDVTDPAAPQAIGFLAGPSSSWRDIKTYGTYAYIVTEGSGEGTGMQIVDLSDPTDPVFVGTYDATFTTAHNLWIDADTGLAWVVGTGNGTRILDLAADPENPVDIGGWTERYVHDAYVADGYAYFSEINDGLHEILDASDPTSLVVLSSWETPDGASHNSWANDAQTIVATTDETTGGHVAVYDVTSKTGPNPLRGEYEPDPSAIVHNVKFDDEDNELVAISHYALGLKVVDLHRPSAPLEWGGYDTYPAGDGGFNGAWGVYAYDPRGYYYVSDIQTGLYVLELVPTGGTLSGVVRDASDGEPVPHARVVDLGTRDVVASGADGVYALYAVEGSDTLVRVDAWGYRSEIRNAGEVLAGTRVDLDVALERIPRVPLTGVVLDDADDAPVAGAKVRIVGSPLTTTTAADGSYTFAEAAAGQQVVTAERFGFAPSETRVLVSPDAPAVADFRLVPAAFADDMEQDRGWVVGSPDDAATTGIWERGEPNGTGGGTVQPDVDATPPPGAECWVTGNAPGASIDDDKVRGGRTTLTSPAIDASAFPAAVLRYQRWVSTAAGALSGGLARFEVSDDGGATWTTFESQSTDASAWTGRQFDLGSRVNLGGDLSYRVVAVPTTSFENFRVLEVALDDVEIVSGCLSRFNPDLPDADRDGTVDVCDACPDDAADDADGDTFCSDADNAPQDANPAQTDGDGDGVGDVVDNCVSEPNAAQRDEDRDGVGDSCDPDIDGDGVPNDLDDDDDGDGVLDDVDLCPTVGDVSQRDRDADGVGDACDADDGVVQGVRFDRALLTWEPENGSEAYHLYRGDLGAEALLAFATCRAATLPVTSYADVDLPRPGEGFLYLVSRVAGGVEGPLGERSDGTAREVGGTCP